MRQRMQETIYQTADAEVSQETGDTLSVSLNQTADAGETLSDSGCRSLSIRQRMQETLYQMQPLSDRVSSASAV